LPPGHAQLKKSPQAPSKVLSCELHELSMQEAQAAGSGWARHAV
jgi:hypothetical protein